ncbi:MAG: phosphoribosylglycinamide formyltransferase [Proteobacteria bacterium]|nr:phosphoribosylglycinamide formyltransferase [Pseudomonadota bacterium]MDA1301716.1 phosphoribosylglycinamide formyltransferase [Pseudomonadota bacterium]
MNLGVLASHRGSNLQAIIEACEAGTIHGRVVLVISNNSDSLALRRARDAGIDAVHLSGHTHPDAHQLDAAILEALKQRQVDLVITAGYLRKLGQQTLGYYQRRIINTHPSLLPAYGGHGMYGRRVHEAVLAAKERQTGITVHYVDADYDTGEIIAQLPVPVRDGDTPELLESRLLAAERPFLVATLARLIPETPYHQTRRGT